jgi:GNAT superfamily N-acetyltransferase
MQKDGKNYKIEMPVSKKDFEEASDLCDKNVVFDAELGVDYYKNLSVGEILIVKDRGKVVAMLAHRRPGEIFNEISDDHFDLSKYKVGKKDIGYVYIIAIDPKYQKRGIGQMLVTKALKYQKEYGSGAVAVHCMQSSPGNASEKLFTKMGFVPVKMHKKPWYKHSVKVGPKGYRCSHCGNPCVCDDLEMMYTF